MIIKKVAYSDLDTLLSLSKTTFHDAYAHKTEPHNFQLYFDVAFRPDKVASELANPFSEFYFAEIDKQVIGYIKLNYNTAQTDLQTENSLEIERIYVLKNTTAGKLARSCWISRLGRPSAKSWILCGLAFGRKTRMPFVFTSTTALKFQASMIFCLAMKSMVIY